MEQKVINLSNHNKSFWIKAIEASIIAVVILVPIAFYPRCIAVFSPAKDAVSTVIILLALMFWGLKMISRGEIKFSSTPLTFPTLSFIAICVLSLIWSNSFFVSLKELPLFLVGPLLYFIITNSINDERQINRILDILLLVGGLFGIYGILQYNGIDLSFWARNVGRHKVFGLFGNVNYFAEYLIVPLPIAVSLFFASRNKFKKILLLIAILAMGTSLIATVTRGSYLGFGVSLIFMSFLFLTSRSKNFINNYKKIFIIILVAVITITFLYVVPTPLNKSGTVISMIKERVSIALLINEFSFGRRIAIWKFTGMMIKDHPLLGSGIGTYKYNTLRYQAEFFAQGENRSLYPHGFADKAHNEYLQLWAELGIIGLGIFIWLIISYFRFGLKILRKIKDEYRQGILIGLMGAIMAVLVDGIFGFPLHLPATIVLFWLALGLTVAVGLKDETNAPEIKMLKENSNIFRFKPLLYIGIILFTIFLCVTVTRPFIAGIYWYYGDKEIKDENWNKAIKMDEEALKWDPWFGQGYFDIGYSLMRKGLFYEAVQYFEKAKKYIDLPGLPQNFALVYLKKGQLDKAAIKLKQAISYQSDEKSMLPLYSDLGNVYLQLERYKPAEAAFKNVLKIDPNLVSAHYGLADTYLRQNKIDEGLVELKKVVELAPNSQEAKYAQDTIQKIEQAKLEAQPTESNNWNDW